MRRAAAAMLAPLVLCCALVPAQGEASLARITSVPMPEGFEVARALSCDVDGDGVADLVIASASASARRLQVHLRRQDGPAFRPAPDAALDLTPDTIAFAAADVHADAGRELLLFGAGVVVAWRWRATGDAARYEKLLAADFLWQWPDRRGLFHWQAGVRDLDGDGLEDLAVPGPAKYTVAFQTKAADGTRAFAPPLEIWPGSGSGGPERTIEVRQPGGRRRTTVSFSGGGIDFSDYTGPPPWLELDESVPAGQLLDWDGDGDLDIAFLTEQHVRVFVQEPKGSFGASPVVLANPVVVDRQRRLDISHSVRALDLDLDQRFDCVISAGDKRSEATRTQVLVFLQKAVAAGEEPLFGKAGVPAQVLVLDGFAAPLAIEDVDGDGLPDLVAGSVRPDLIDGLRAAASERIEAEVYVFRNTRTGFGKRPDLTHKLAVQATGLGFTARFLGDVTGDGVSELFERAEKDKLRVHLVRKTSDGLAVAGKPLFELTVDENARLLLPKRLGPGTWDLFVLEKGAVRCASFR